MGAKFNQGRQKKNRPQYRKLGIFWAKTGLNKRKKTGFNSSLLSVSEVSRFH
jgi:hypothetical protein